MKVELYALTVYPNHGSKWRWSWRKNQENYAGLLNQLLVAFCKLLNKDTKYFHCCENPTIVHIDGVVVSVETKRILDQNLYENSLTYSLNQDQDYISSVSKNWYYRSRILGFAREAF
jgi:hypothetical protein